MIIRDGTAGAARFAGVELATYVPGSEGLWEAIPWSSLPMTVPQGEPIEVRDA